jgi:hypothetical protein
MEKLMFFQMLVVSGPRFRRKGPYFLLDNWILRDENAFPESTPTIRKLMAENEQQC